MSYLKGDMSGLFKGLTSTFKQVSGAQSGAVEKTRRTKTSPADVISFSGCKDEQVRPALGPLLLASGLGTPSRNDC